VHTRYYACNSHEIQYRRVYYTLPRVIVPAEFYFYRAAKLDLFLAPMAFSSEGSLMFHTYCDKGPRFINVRSLSKDQIDDKQLAKL
jgi:hypothetical protein